jgi:hypothetical protein
LSRVLPLIIISSAAPSIGRENFPGNALLPLAIDHSWLF